MWRMLLRHEPIDTAVERRRVQASAGVLAERGGGAHAHATGVVARRALRAQARGVDVRLAVVAVDVAPGQWPESRVTNHVAADQRAEARAVARRELGLDVALGGARAVAVEALPHAPAVVCPAAATGPEV